MVRRVEHLVEVTPIKGLIRDLTPSMDPESIKQHSGSKAYEALEGQVVGVLRLAGDVAALRVERRPGGVLFGWAAERPPGEYIYRIHSLGDSQSAFFVIKNGKLHGQDPWIPALPGFVLESVKKVEVARLDSPNGTVTWERGRGQATSEVNVLVEQDGLGEVRRVCKALGVGAVFNDLMKAMEGLKP